MRDPLDYLKDRVEGRVYRKVHGVKHRIHGTVDGAGRKLVHKGEDLVTGKKKDTAGGQKKAPKKKKMGWWPFGGDDDETSIPVCGGCNKEVDDSWDLCPYCGHNLKGAAVVAPGQPPVPGSGAAPASAGGGGGGSQRTVAIDLDALKAPNREVVGWLVVMNGTQKGVDFRVYTGRNSIGAAADNDIVVTDEYLSSKHSTIRYEDGRYELIDNDSTNGSFVNEKRVTKEELIDNDTVRLGRTELRFKALY